MAYDPEALERSLLQVGIRPACTVFVTTGLGFLGPAQSVTSEEQLNRLHLQTLKRVVGPQGTIVVPTYSYTFGKSLPGQLAVYDPETTAAEIGSFPNYVLNSREGIRSADPMMSVYCIGSNAQKLVQDLPKSSYGSGCIFERLLDENTLCLSLGLGPNWTPFIHYLDFVKRVEYRYEKLFWGYIKNGEELIRQSWNYTVRPGIINTKGDCQRLGNLAESHCLWKREPLGKGIVCCASYQDYYDFASSAFHDLAWPTARGPVCDVMQQESIKRHDHHVLLARANAGDCQSRCFRDRFYPISGHNLEALFRELTGLLKGCVIDHIGIETGSVLDDLIIPECWQILKCRAHWLEGDQVGDPVPIQVIPNSRSFKGEVVLHDGWGWVIDHHEDQTVPGHEAGLLVSQYPAFAIHWLEADADPSAAEGQPRKLHVEHEALFTMGMMEVIILKPVHNTTTYSDQPRVAIIDTFDTGSFQGLADKDVAIAAKDLVATHDFVIIGPYPLCHAAWSVYTGSQSSSEFIANHDAAPTINKKRLAVLKTNTDNGIKTRGLNFRIC